MGVLDSQIEPGQPMPTAAGGVSVYPGVSAHTLVGDESIHPEKDDVYLDKWDNLAKLAMGNYIKARQSRNKWEHLWFLLTSNMEGIYHRWIPTDPEDSLFFYQKTRQCVVEAQSKILQLIDPPADRVWELQSSPMPYVPWLDEQNPENADAAEAAMDMMRLEMETDLENMNFKSLKAKMALSLPLYGSGVIFGPVRLSKPRKRFLNRAAFSQAEKVVGQATSGGLDPLANLQSFLKDNPEVASAMASDSGNGWVEIQDPSDLRRPEYMFRPIWNIYPDPAAEDVKDCEYIIDRDHYTRSYVRGLMADSSFRSDMLERLLRENPEGAFESEWWENGGDNTQTQRENRYTIFRYYGFFNGQDFEEAGLDPGEFGLDPESHREACFEIWVCRGLVLKVAKRDFNDDRLPFHIVPMEKRDSCIWGRGTAECLKDVQDVLNSTGRAMHDNLRHASGVNLSVDMSAVVPGTDLSIRGRKVWPYRRGEFTGTGKVIEAFALPSLQKDLMEAFNHWDRLAPLICSLPKLLMQQQNMGSGVRTDYMLDTLFEAAETFIKLVIGNIDEYWFRPKMTEIYEWEMKYNPRPGIHGDFSVQALGVSGAMQREIVGKRAISFFQVMSANNGSDWLNDPEIMKAVTMGLGMDSKKAVVSAKDYVERQKAKIAQAQAQAAAEKAGESAGSAKERAESSTRDILLQAVKDADNHNPAKPGMTAQLLQSIGKLTPQIEAGLNAWGRQLAQQAIQTGAANPEEAMAISNPVGPPQPPPSSQPAMPDQGAMNGGTIPQNQA